MQLEAGEGAGRGLWPASPLFLVTASFGLSTANPGLGLGDCPVNPLNSVIVTGGRTTWLGGWPLARVTVLVRGCTETRTQVSAPSVPSA